jgi:rhamnogalacturonyl hydrolase YesR
MRPVDSLKLNRSISSNNLDLGDMADASSDDKSRTTKREVDRNMAISSDQPRPESTYLRWSSLPLYIGVAAVLMGFYLVKPTTVLTLNTTSYEICATTFDYGLPIAAIISQATRYSHQAWEISALFEAKMQIYDPDRSVFGRIPFPDGRPPSLGLRLDEASLYVANLIDVKGKSLFPDEDTMSAPASLGIAALMTGQGWKPQMEAASKQRETLLAGSRFQNGAISNHADRLEVSSRAIGQFAPFLAYYGVVYEDSESISEAVRQIEHHRDVLMIPDGSGKGMWKNLEGPPRFADARPWSVSNAVAAFGMAQVRSIIAAWPKSNSSMRAKVDSLDKYVFEILTAAVSDHDKESGLLHEQLGDETSSLMSSSTALFAAIVYRMASINADVFARNELLQWAHNARRTLSKSIGSDGALDRSPGSVGTKPHGKTAVDPEAQSYLLMLAAAWRDCVCNGMCLEAYLQEKEVS